MPPPGVVLDRLGFLTIGLFDGDNPGPGHQTTLEIIELAEDLGTVDVLSGGRLNPGVSVGAPMHFEDVKAALYPDTADIKDFSYERVSRLLRLVGGEPASTFQGVEGMEQFSSRVQPHSPGCGAGCGTAGQARPRRAGPASIA